MKTKSRNSNVRPAFARDADNDDKIRFAAEAAGWVKKQLEQPMNVRAFFVGVSFLVRKHSSPESLMSDVGLMENVYLRGCPGNLLYEEAIEAFSSTGWIAPKMPQEEER